MDPHAPARAFATKAEAEAHIRQNMRGWDAHAEEARTGLQVGQRDDPTPAWLIRCNGGAADGSAAYLRTDGYVR